MKEITQIEKLEKLLLIQQCIKQAEKYIDDANNYLQKYTHLALYDYRGEKRKLIEHKQAAKEKLTRYYFTILCKMTGEVYESLSLKRAA